MSEPRSKPDECFILVKAQPHRSSKYFETVCCAGVGRDGKWRRQYPVPFRILQGDQKFSRWDWIEYEYVKGEKDPREESQKVLAQSLRVTDKIKKSERAKILNPLIRRSFADADARGESLALIRPKRVVLKSKRKTDEDLRKETQKHKELADQLSFFDETAKPLKPCPVQFIVEWIDQDGKSRKHENDDWETSAAYNRFERMHGHVRAVEILKEKYEQQYFEAGLALAFSTHSRRNVHFAEKNQWLLVGLIRLDEEAQDDLFLSG